MRFFLSLSSLCARTRLARSTHGGIADDPNWLVSFLLKFEQLPQGRWCQHRLPLVRPLAHLQVRPPCPFSPIFPTHIHRSSLILPLTPSHRFFRAWANDGIRNLNDSSHFVLCGAAAAHLTLYLLVLSERLTWRSSSARDPLTGAARPALDLECERAIARAPAGQPYLERGWKGTALSTLLGGPGFAAAMWWARGEEEAGWKARKAWRETVAVEGKKQ